LFFKVWQEAYHAERIFRNTFIKQKIQYIPNNPVKEKIITLPEAYYFNAALETMPV
jgi:hypothetical protein